jgi:hypothetical protein
MLFRARFLVTEESSSATFGVCRVLLTAINTTSTIPDLATIHHFDELLKIVPASRGSRVVRRRLDGASISGRAYGRSGLVSGSSSLAGGVQDLLCCRAAKESLNMPKKILLVISAHTKEAELVIRGHRMTDLLHLVVRHLVAAGLRSLNDCTEQKLELVQDLGVMVQDQEEVVGLGLQLTSFTGAPEMPTTSVTASTPISGTLVPQRVGSVAEPQGS